MDYGGTPQGPMFLRPPDGVQPKQDLDPFSRFCTVNPSLAELQLDSSQEV